MITNQKKSNKNFVINGIFNSKQLDKNIIKKINIITDFISNKESFIYLGERNKFSKESMTQISQIISKSNRNYEINIKSFVTKNVSEEEIITSLTEKYLLIHGEKYTLKTKDNKKTINLNLLGLTSNGENIFKKVKKETEIINWVRNLQVMPPNKLNSENYSEILEKEFNLPKHKNISVKILNKKQIEKLGMGLLLGVNKGSQYEPKVVILEYLGNNKSQEKMVYVGKGITFDSGGYSLKPSKFMSNMKYDMSGSAIVAGAMKLISLNKPKTNISAVLPITDNMIGKGAQVVDSIQTSMNGKTVEINNTDAEGRLILADGISYAIKKLKATKIVDIATLTGAILVALGNTYTGVWTTDDKDWKLIKKSANKKNELVWRMPLHKDFSKYIKDSKISDIRNTDYTGKGGSCSAAMFLKEFTEDIPFIHFDIAGTADIENEATGVMTKTLSEMAND